MESKQTFKGDQFASSGHTYAKTKFSFDGSNKMNNEKPRFKGAVKGASDAKKSSGSSSFKNPFSKFVLPAVSNVKHGNAVGTQDSMALETQGSASQNSRSVGWGQISSQNSSPLTPCYAFGSFGQKKEEPSTPARRPTSSGMSEMPSTALPWTTTNLTGELVGDVGFDPLGFSKYAPGAWWFGDEGDGSLKIFREAELMHGRIAQLACLGFVFPEIAHFPGNESVGQDAFGVMN